MRSFLVRAAAVVLAIAGPLFAHADTLYLSPSSSVQSPGRTFAVNVFVSSLSQPINAVSGVLSFPPDKLQVVSVSKVASILTLWVAEPSFSNADGTVTFEGVVPNPGFTGSAGRIVTINFKAVGQGEAQLRFDSGSVLANDGNGTNILKTLGTALYTISGSVVPPTADPNETTPSGPNTPPAPVITADPFASSRKWYSSRTGTFSWKVGDGITATRLLVGKLPDSTPTVVYEPPISMKEITDLDDGVWYFHAQLRNNIGWGAITHYQVRVDATKPEAFSITEIARADKTEPRPRFVLQATDSVSGISHYEIQVDNAEPIKWTDNGTGIFEAPAFGPGSHSLVARAYDEAGNFAASPLDFYIEPIETPHIDSYTERVNAENPLSVEGRAIPNATVHVYMTKKGEEPIAISVKSDSAGAFSALFDREMPNGAYKLTAVAEDKRGAQSEPSAEKTVMVGSSRLVVLATKVLNALAVFIPILVLVFALIFLFLWFWHRVNNFRKRIRKELHDVENMIEQAFILLKEDVEDSIRMLEHTKSKRSLTKEEEEIMARFRANITEARRVIKKEIRDVEREIGG